MAIKTKNSIIGDRPDADRYDRMEIRNGWDLPAGKIPPVTGRKRESARAYELLVLKTDEEYEAAARLSRLKRQLKEYEKKVEAAQILMEAGEGTGEEVKKSGRDRKAERPPEKDTKDSGGKTASASDGSEESYEGIAIRSSASFRAGRTRRLALVLAVLILILAGIDARLAFGPAVSLADISAYEELQIDVEGLTDEPFVITAKDLKKMPMKKIRVPVHKAELGEGEVAERGQAAGPTLDTFLEAYGATTDDMKSMKVYTSSDRSTAYVRTMKEEEIILAIADGNHPLRDRQAPLRIAVESQEADEWSGGIRRIVFNRK